MPPLRLNPGTRLGPYEITAPLGAGGMGEVYKASDTRLDRTVAIKILPDTLGADPQFRERFNREARAISKMSHPHICTLFDVGHLNNTDFLVLEYLEGRSLADRLEQGALPLHEALRVGIEIAGALDTAHTAGIVHRDLKPQNVMLTNTGAKLLDFGLAKTAAPVVGGSGASMIPTTPPSITAQGTILGTFQYMAPEQIEGEEADARTDIFAFGAVLYETLTGAKAFEGKTRASLLGAILKDEPPPVSRTVTVAPQALDRVVRKCLAKNPAARWQTARDLCDELKWIAEGGARVHETMPSGRSRAREWIGWATALAIAIVATAAVIRRPATEEAPRMQFAISVPSSTPITTSQQSVAISPDGRNVVFRAASDLGGSQLFVRRIDQGDATPLAGTEGGTSPFFSPDGEWLGFFQGGKLHKIRVGGGSKFTICDAQGGAGGTWRRDDTIVFAGSNGPLYSIPASGGLPREITTVDVKRERVHRWPTFLPNGKSVLFVAGPVVGGSEDGNIMVKLLATGQERLVMSGASHPRVLANGNLIVARRGTLLYVPFDADQAEVRGTPTPIVQNVAGLADRDVVQFDASSAGVLVYMPAMDAPGDTTFVWVDRHGIEQPAARVKLSSLGEFALSPDGGFIALSAGERGSNNIWLYDLRRGGLARITSGSGSQITPVWTPDGRHITYAASAGGQIQTFSKSADGSGKEELSVSALPLGVFPRSWSPDGRWLLVSRGSGPTNNDLFVAPADGRAALQPITATANNKFFARFSPDGHWIAYQSDDSGRDDIYVTSFPDAVGKWKVSTDGGRFPVWAPNDREIFYRNRDGLVACPVTLSPSFRADAPQVLFQGSYAATFDVSRDGQRFLMIKAETEGTTRPQLNVVVNWLSDLAARAPSR